jgi:hypothetical protein
MESRFDEIVGEAIQLTLRDRVRLAQYLVSTIDDESETCVETLWFEQAERRLEEIHSGKVEGLDADYAFKNARDALKG